MRIHEILLEDRTDFLRGKYLPLINGKLASLRMPDDVRTGIGRSPGGSPAEQMFNWLKALDPTPNLQYLQWILGCAIDRMVPLEDFVDLRGTLEKYTARKRTNTLPADARDINLIKTPSQLDVLLRDVEGGEVAASDKEAAAARKASQVLLDDADWLVLIPKTEAAAQFYGRGTEWCTAWGDPKGLHPTRICRFNGYNRRGPMVIAINKDASQERYQFHDPSEQYKDRNDRQLFTNDLVQLGRKSPALARVLMPYVPILGVFGNEHQQLEAIRTGGEAIQYIRDPSETMQLAAVRQEGRVIQYIQDPSPAIQLAAVRQEGRAIEYIKNPTPEIELAAVRQAGLAIEYIKNPTPAIQLAAIRQTRYAIQYIKNPTPEVGLAAVQQNGGALGHIKNPTPEIELAAVRQEGLAIRHIKNPTPAIQLAAIRQDSRAIRFIENPTPEAIRLARQ